MTDEEVKHYDDKWKRLDDEIATLRAELETEKRCHALAKSFHDLAIADRNLADHKLAQSERAREKAEAVLAAVAALHDEYDGPHTYCHECGGLTPCETRRAVHGGK